MWLNTLIDNEEQDLELPIYRTASPQRLIQNYLTNDMIKNAPNGVPMEGLDDIVQAGTLVFRAQFHAGMDPSHEGFVADNDSRETFETWEACYSEGVRGEIVEKELPERVSELHEKSLTQGRDVLKEADEEEKHKWLTKTGTDWSGAFGEDPANYMDSKGRKKREPGADPPLNGDEREHDPNNPSSDDDSDDDLGIQDGDSVNGSVTSGRQSIGTMESGWTAGTNESSSRSTKDINKQNKKTEERKQRGLMQWKPARNLKFVKDEGLIGVRKLKNRMTGSMEGRQPGVETETGS